MQIKVFKAATMKDAVAAMRAELGSKAVILHSKKYKESGLLGLRTREVVEITAAVEDPPNQDKKDSAPQITQAPQPANIAAAQYKKNAPENSKSKNKKAEKTDAAPLAPEEKLSEADIQKLQNALKRAKENSPIEIESQSDAEILNSPDEPKKAPPLEVPKKTSTPKKFQPEQITATPPPVKPVAQKFSPPVVEKVSPPPQPSTSENLRVEEKQPIISFTQEQMAQFQAMMFAQFQQMQNVQQPPPPPPKVEQIANAVTPEQERIQQLEGELAQMKKMLADVLSQNSQKSGLKLREALQQQEVSEEILNEMEDTEVDYQSGAAKWTLSSYFSEHFNFAEGIRLNRRGRKIVALIGTTGVGKTTTLAKIAAKFVLEQGIRPALITADTYRISAVEQLKTYSDILNLPLDIVYSPQELTAALERHTNNELVLIDTAGRSQYSEGQMLELQEFLKTNPNIEKHLAISASFKLSDAKEIVRKFSAVKPDRIIITKIDETANFGTAVNLLREVQFPLSFLTMGQSVPDDIAVGSADSLTKLLLDKINAMVKGAV